MRARTPPKLSVRCAIYTRVSTDAGLDQEFNSLDAQYDASAAYIRSQAHAGWTQIRSRYDDGGFSGGSTDRPALQKLLEDVRAGRLDTIVVYKVDRLTRSLADFAKLVELFDRHGVSFVSVTQQFNTTTSMGRLTLNVLLSFAQFEREVTSERIRDKIAASKRKGLWVGGVVPLGYHSKDRKITIVAKEAETVRHIFKRYLELGSLGTLLTDLRQDGISTRRRQLASGKVVGGIPFNRGGLVWMLRNRFYIGEIKFKGEILAGEQPKILDRNLFDAVQAKLDEQRTNHVTAREASDALLMGRIFDDAGHLMTPVHSLRRGRRYRYYVSSVLAQGQSAAKGSVSRVPADQIEALVLQALRAELKIASDEKNRQVLKRLVRIEVSTDNLVAHVAPPDGLSVAESGNDQSTPMRRDRKVRDATVIRIPWTKRPSKMPREIIPPTDATDRIDVRPIRSETRAKLVEAIGQGRHWLAALVSGTVKSAEELSIREGCSAREINRCITLAFLSPRLVEAAVAGALPRGVGVATLHGLPVEWTQHAALGLKI